MPPARRFLWAGLALAVAAVACVALDPLGPLRGPLLLVVALPIMARALARLGWVPVAARPFATLRPGPPAVLAAYGAWLGMSALLTLDVAAVVAVPVGLSIARRHRRDGRSHVAAAVVGANVGSLVFPFSNLTNLVLVAGTGISFGAFVGLAWLPQVAAAIGAGVVLTARARSLERRRPSPTTTRTTVERRHETAGDDVDPADVQDDDAGPLGRYGLASGAIALFGAIGTVVLGFAGGDVATALTLVGAVITALALLDGRLAPLAIRRAIPWSAVAVIVAAGLLREPIAALAAHLPVPGPTVPAIVAYPAVALVGGLLAAAVNNLPAAAFGAIWLHAAGGPLVIAYLLGTNILALVTPHGSVATMLGRTLAHRGGVVISPRDYLWRGWRYAVAATIPALLVLVAIH